MMAKAFLLPFGIAAIMWIAILLGLFDDRKDKKKPRNRAA
jgi:hypothetical protein